MPRTPSTPVEQMEADDEAARARIARRVHQADRVDDETGEGVLSPDPIVMTTEADDIVSVLADANETHPPDGWVVENEDGPIVDGWTVEQEVAVDLRDPRNHDLIGTVEPDDMAAEAARVSAQALIRVQAQLTELRAHREALNDRIRDLVEQEVTLQQIGTVWRRRVQAQLRDAAARRVTS